MSWWTCLVLKSLLAATCMVVVQSQTQPQLVFHFVANTTSKTKLPDSRDIHLQAHLESLLYGLMCKSPGNKFIVRVSPGSGTTEVVDEIIGLHNTSDNVKNCLFPGLNPIKCDEENFCALGNKCTATVMAVCQRHGTMSRWLMTQVVDVTIDQVDGAIVLVRCLTKCSALQIKKDDKKKQRVDSALTKALKNITRCLILAVRKLFMVSCLFCFCYQPFSAFP